MTAVQPAPTYTPVAQKDSPPTLIQMIDRMKGEIGRALPRHLNADRMARIATTTLRQTPKLAQCTPESFLGALLTASQLGLEPGPTGEAYLVPYGTVCTFIPGYRGLIKLARNSGLVSDIYAEIVYANDAYQVTLGLDRDIKHVMADGDRGEATNVYAVAKFKDGERTFVTMTRAEVEAIRKRSKASGNGPWVTDWEAMAKKTAVKQLAKWLPLSAEFTTAAQLDGSVRTSVGDLVDVTPDYYIDGTVDEQNAIEPPADVVLASKEQIAKLANIRKAEGHDDASWAAFVAATIPGIDYQSDAALTLENAQELIDVFNTEAAK